LLTTSVDREWTDLPIRPGFLPLIQEAARYLAGAPSGEATAALAVGEKREITLEPDERRIEVIPPAGESRWLMPASRPDPHSRRAVVFTDTDEPGFYRVRPARADGTIADRPDASFVVDLASGESDPARLPDDRRPDRTGGRTGAGQGPVGRRAEQRRQHGRRRRHGDGAGRLERGHAGGALLDARPQDAVPLGG